MKTVAFSAGSTWWKGTSRDAGIQSHTLLRLLTRTSCVNCSLGHSSSFPLLGLSFPTSRRGQTHEPTLRSRGVHAAGTRTLQSSGSPPAVSPVPTAQLTRESHRRAHSWGEGSSHVLLSRDLLLGWWVKRMDGRVKNKV